MQTVEIIPSASALIQSLRGLGYSPETAVADLVDNSIAAGADAVDIDIDWNDGDPRVAILDNGRGLDGDSLVDAMRFGGAGPSTKRAPGDLGRFGLGLKTASLSQCRLVTVASRNEGRLSMLAWDVDEVTNAGRWHAGAPQKRPHSNLSERFDEVPSGTLVVWERMDAVGGLAGLDKETFFLRIRDVATHLGMVFHRFLGGESKPLAISVNGRRVRPWDPFQRTHSATITLQTEQLRHAGAALTVTPYVLPHRDRFANDLEYEEAGGPGGWSERQGFYLYRGKRLVVTGGWLGLGGSRAWTREESSRLARIAVDLPVTVDLEWRVDVRKSLARPPGALRPRLTAIATVCRNKAREVFAWRGGRARGQSTIPADEPVWIGEQVGQRIRYRINRRHPVVSALSQNPDHQTQLLEPLLAIVERTVPVERIWLDVSEAGDGTVPPMDEVEVATLATKLATLVSRMPGNNVANLDNLIRHLPGNSTALRRAAMKLLEVSDE